VSEESSPLVEQLAVLLRVHDLDGGIRAAEEEIGTFRPRREEAARQEVADRAAGDAARALLADREHEHRRLEPELGDADVLVEKLETQVYEVRSKQALDAIETEIAAGRERKSGLEDQILELLDGIESATAGVSDAEAAASEHVALHRSEDTAMSQREGVLRAELVDLRTLRDSALQGLAAETVRSYESARRRAWPVMVRVETKSCPSCRIVIAPQKWVEISGCTRLITCGSCHRILYGDKVAAPS
jgi:predicted  nucleic acid-binding Zn-ribbon protein